MQLPYLKVACTFITLDIHLSNGSLISECLFLFIFFSECSNQTDFDLPNENSINITSPSFPNFYPDNVDCLWTFSSPHIKGSYLVYFHEVILLQVTLYVDFLTLGTGTEFSERDELLTLKTFGSPGTVVIVEHPELWIRFISGNKYRNTGFSVTVEKKSILGKSVSVIIFLKDIHIRTDKIGLLIFFGKQVV